MNEILIAKNLTKAFGRVQAVADVSFAVRQGELLGVLGPNGAGKTSMFNLLTGIYMPDGGQIIFEGHDITHMAAFKRCNLGLGRTFQIPRPFGDMTVYENLLVGATFGGGRREKDCKKEISQILEMTDLWDRRNNFARTLPLLGRKRLELARGLATGPKVLLLDEIAGGLTEAEAHEVLDVVKTIQSRGVTIIWIEHIMSMMEGVDRLLALAQGCTIMCDDPQSVMCSEEVTEWYLGVEHGE
jgi:branched-chain amino acid transport system ATP-binding protein